MLIFKYIVPLFIVCFISGSHCKPADNDIPKTRRIGATIWSWITYPFTWWFSGTTDETPPVNDYPTVSSTFGPYDNIEFARHNVTIWCNDHTCTTMKCDQYGCINTTCNIYDTDVTGNCRQYNTGMKPEEPPMPQATAITSRLPGPEQENEVPVNVLDHVTDAPVNVSDQQTVAPASIPYQVTKAPVNMPVQMTGAPVNMPNQVTRAPVNMHDQVTDTPVKVPDHKTVAPVSMPYQVTRAPVNMPVQMTEAPVNMPDQVTDTSVNVPYHKTVAPVSMPDKVTEAPVNILVQTTGTPVSMSDQVTRAPVNVAEGSISSIDVTLGTFTGPGLAEERPSRDHTTEV